MPCTKRRGLRIATCGKDPYKALRWSARAGGGMPSDGSRTFAGAAAQRRSHTFSGVNRIPADGNVDSRLRSRLLHAGYANRGSNRLVSGYDSAGFDGHVEVDRAADTAVFGWRRRHANLRLAEVDEIIPRVAQIHLPQNLAG